MSSDISITVKCNDVIKAKAYFCLIQGLKGSPDIDAYSVGLVFFSSALILPVDSTIATEALQ